MCVEQFAAKRAIEAFGVSVLRRLAGLNPVYGNILLLTLLAQPGTDKLGTIIRPQLRGAPMVLNQTRQHLHNATGGQGKINFYPQ